MSEPTATRAANVVDATGVPHRDIVHSQTCKTGTIDAVCGCFVYPDANAHGGGEDPRWLYTVRFSARELWGDDADPTLSVSIDAFEPYLDPA